VHGALLVGKRHAIAPRKTEWQRELATFKVELYQYCDSKLVRPGGGSLVLDSPLAALRPLRAGEIISTGTLTLAMPVKLGERWTSTTLGVPLEGNCHSIWLAGRRSR
jgi:2-keto-4-pentenoate hydratase